MKEKYKKLFFVMLNRLRNYQSSAGCNDFDLIEDGNLSELEAKEIQAELFENGYGDELMTGTFTFDFFITLLLNKKVKNL